MIRPSPLFTLTIAAVAVAATSAAWAAPKLKPASGPDQVSIDTQASRIGWEGRKLIGPHVGTIQLKSGEVDLQAGQLKGGAFVVDMNTLVDEDLKDPAYNQKLVGHLKSDDFFDVAKYPTSRFKITQVRELAPGSANTHEITGELTMKDQTHPVTFPARVEVREGQAIAQGKLVIDRTKWNIRYGSGKFFQGLGDKMIDDKFTLDVRIVGKAL